MFNRAITGCHKTANYVCKINFGSEVASVLTCKHRCQDTDFSSSSCVTSRASDLTATINLTCSWRRLKVLTSSLYIWKINVIKKIADIVSGCTRIHRFPPNPANRFGTDTQPNLTALDALYPDGDTLTLTVGGGTFAGDSGSITLPSPSMFPPTPAVANFNALLSMDPTQDFTVQFNQFVPDAGAISSVHNLFVGGCCGGFQFPETPVPGSGSVTEVLIPANTLTAGDPSVLFLLFQQTFSATVTLGSGTAFNSTIGFVGYDTQLNINFTPVPEPGTDFLIVLGAGFLLLQLWPRRSRYSHT